jgi:ribosomal protein L15
MSNPRRDFLKNLFALGALPGLFNSPAAAARTLNLLAEQSGAQNANHEIDTKSYSFWNNFLESEADPIVTTGGQQRGGNGINGENETQPVFMHYGKEGFRNAAELDATNLVTQGDVSVSMNTSAIKMAAKDADTFKKLQNAQVRVDVIQKQAIIPILEAMAYTVVAAMRVGQMEASALKQPAPKPGTASAASKIPLVQSVNVNSDAAWQKMQNIPLPAGEGRWTLNLEAQRKESLFAQVLQNVIKEAGLFAPVVGLPGIALSALQSFNNLYGALHSQPVSIIKAPPLRVFATQEAVERTGAPGAVSGILLQSGTYILIPANQMPSDDQLKKLTVASGCMVPTGTAAKDVTEAAENTLTDVTYATFDVEVRPMTLIAGSSGKSSS